MMIYINKCFLFFLGLVTLLYFPAMADNNICEEDWYSPGITPVNLNENDIHWKITCDCDCSMKNNEIMLIRWNGGKDNLSIEVKGIFSNLLVLDESLKNGLKPISILRKVPNNLGNKSIPYVYESYRFEYNGNNYVLAQNSNKISDDRLILGTKNQSELINSGVLNVSGVASVKENAMMDYIREYVQVKLNDGYKKALSAFRKKKITDSAEYSLKIVDISPWRFLKSNKKNLTIYNDLGFFLEQGKKYYEAILILNEVIRINPKRKVAYINLGDAYFGANNIEQAKHAYQKYIDLMKKAGKQKRIPKRVYARLK